MGVSYPVCALGYRLHQVGQNSGALQAFAGTERFGLPAHSAMIPLEARTRGAVTGKPQ